MQGTTTLVHHCTQDFDEPLKWVHFKAEGDVEFKSLLFVPKVRGRGYMCLHPLQGLAKVNACTLQFLPIAKHVHPCRALLLQVAPYNFFDKYYEKSTAGPKLYVRRVFISDDVTELLPRWVLCCKPHWRFI